MSRLANVLKPLLDLARKNFFANVNALHAEQKLHPVDSDGQHHFEAPELELLDRCVPLLPFLSWRTE